MNIEMTTQIDFYQDPDSESAAETCGVFPKYNGSDP